VQSLTNLTRYFSFFYLNVVLVTRTHGVVLILNPNKKFLQNFFKYWTTLQLIPVKIEIAIFETQNIYFNGFG